MDPPNRGSCGETQRKKAHPAPFDKIKAKKLLRQEPAGKKIRNT
jgi:hypothetical protein